MLSYIIKRLLMMIFVILGVLAVVFFFQAISTVDPVDSLLEGATVEDKIAKREELGLNDPIVVQYGRYLWNFVSKGSLGTSYLNGKDIMTEFASRFPITVVIAFGAVILGMIIGIPLGILSAVKQYTWVDSVVLAFSVIACSVPSFWLALMLILQFSVKLQWLPALGISKPGGWVLPIVVVAVGSLANIVRTTRSSMLETIRQDYVRTARAKGQKEYIITFKHVFRNSLIPIVTVVGNTIGHQLGGALIVETVFGIPGIGKYAVDAICGRDYAAVQGCVFILAATFTILNLVIDLVYTLIDPKIKQTFVKAKRKKVAKPQVVSEVQ